MYRTESTISIDIPEKTLPPLDCTIGSGATDVYGKAGDTGELYFSGINIKSYL